MVTCFLIPGRPVGKARPRMNTQTGAAYTPQSTKDYERRVKYAYINAYPAVSDRLHQGAVAVEITAYFPIPASWAKYKKRAALAGKMQPETKPDWDNIGKIITDALNGLAYRDDAQVVTAIVSKRYAEIAHVVVRLESGGGLDG